MRTLYRIDDFQQVYFVIPSLDALLQATLQDFGAIYERLTTSADLAIETLLPGDLVISRGDQSHARSGGAAPIAL